MELKQTVWTLYGLWWENRDGFRGLSSWMGEGKWGYAVATSSNLFNNQGIIKLFDTYEEASKLFDKTPTATHIIGGWIKEQKNV